MIQMRDRRTASASLSVQVLNWVMARGHTQADIARMLGLSQGFISLVKARERCFTMDHFAEMADGIGIPLGVFLIQATAPAKRSDNPDTAALMDVTERLIRKADALRNSFGERVGAGTRKS